MKEITLSKEEFYSKLSTIYVLSLLNKNKIDLIGSYCKQDFWRAQDCLIRHHSNDKNVFFLLKGKLRATITSAKGKEIGYREIRKGEMFGELSAIDNQPRSISVIAVKPSITAVLCQRDFLSLIHHDSEFAMAVMKHITKMVRDVSEKVFQFGTMNINERVYIELLRMAQPYMSNSDSVEITSVPTHTEIANMIGANREAVTREMNTLKKSGLISLKKGRTLIITDIQELERIVHRILD